MEFSPTAQRTRHDIIESAVVCWARNAEAPLADIASHAKVGRTTLSRYFPSRESLEREVDEEARRRVMAALQRAALGDGTGREALLRAARALLAEEDVLRLIFADRPVVDPDGWESESGGGQDPASFTGAILRGQRDGSLSADLPAHWVETFWWTSLFAGRLTLDRGVPAHRVEEWLTRSLSTGLSGM